MKRSFPAIQVGPFLIMYSGKGGKPRNCLGKPPMVFRRTKKLHLITILNLPYGLKVPFPPIPITPSYVQKCKKRTKLLQIDNRLDLLIFRNLFSSYSSKKWKRFSIFFQSISASGKNSISKWARERFYKMRESPVRMPC
jgi:hypothetical protein